MPTTANDNLIRMITNPEQLMIEAVKTGHIVLMILLMDPQLLVNREAKAELDEIERLQQEIERLIIRRKLTDNIVDSIEIEFLQREHNSSHVIDADKLQKEIARSHKATYKQLMADFQRPLGKMSLAKLKKIQAYKQLLQDELNTSQWRIEPGTDFKELMETNQKKVELIKQEEEKLHQQREAIQEKIKSIADRIEMEKDEMLNEFFDQIRGQLPASITRVDVLTAIQSAKLPLTLVDEKGYSLLQLALLYEVQAKSFVVFEFLLSFGLPLIPALDNAAKKQDNTVLFQYFKYLKKFRHMPALLLNLNYFSNGKHLLYYALLEARDSGDYLLVDNLVKPGPLITKIIGQLIRNSEFSAVHRFFQHRQYLDPLPVWAVDATDLDNKTLLLDAFMQPAKQFDAQWVTYLLREGSNMDYVLRKIAKEQAIEALRAVVSYFKEAIKLPDWVIESTDAHGNTLLHYALKEAFETNDFRVFFYLLNQGLFLFQPNRQNFTPWHIFWSYPWDDDRSREAYDAAMVRLVDMMLVERHPACTQCFSRYQEEILACLIKQKQQLEQRFIGQRAMMDDLALGQLSLIYKFLLIFADAHSEMRDDRLYQAIQQASREQAPEFYYENFGVTLMRFNALAQELGHLLIAHAEPETSILSEAIIRERERQAALVVEQRMAAQLEQERQRARDREAALLEQLAELQRRIMLAPASSGSHRFQIDISQEVVNATATSSTENLLPVVGGDPVRLPSLFFTTSAPTPQSGSNSARLQQ